MEDCNQSNEAENNNYIIYKAENLLNGQVYIGATSNSIENRKLDHIERAKRGEKNKFHESIRTYGEYAFKWVQIDTARCVDELAQKEKDFIYEYKTKKDGLNSDSGGGFKKSVYQYSKQDGSLIATYSCLKEAASTVDSSKQNISRACLSVTKEFSGYYWSYKDEEEILPIVDNRKRAVVQLNLNGEIINSYGSIVEASETLGINKTSIAKVCRGERNTAGGFIWKYKDLD